MRWVVIGGEWMFSFFLICLFFGLLCRAGFPIITHPLSARVTLKGVLHLPMKQKHSCSSKERADGENLKRLEKEENPFTEFSSMGSIRCSFEIFVFT